MSYHSSNNHFLPRVHLRREVLKKKKKKKKKETKSELLRRCHKHDKFLVACLVEML